MDFRDYDPAVARWVVLDPVVHHSLSPYNAFDNNPVFWADPSGADAVYNWEEHDRENTGIYSNGQNGNVAWKEALAGNTEEIVLKDFFAMLPDNFFSERNVVGKGYPKPAGFVTFKGLTKAQLNMFRVIPENAKGKNDMILPQNDVLYESDGLYSVNWTAKEYWYKIGGGKIIEVSIQNEQIMYTDATYFLSIANLISNMDSSRKVNHIGQIMLLI